MGCHPNTVKFLDWFYKTQKIAPKREVFMVMEFASNNSLPEFINSTFIGKDSKIPNPIIQQIALQVANALLLFHSLDIVWRDFSPDNILVFDYFSNSNQIKVKIADFGITKQINDDKTRAIGKIKWGNPSFIQNINKKYIPKPEDDNYVFGTFLYYLWTKKNSFRK